MMDDKTSRKTFLSLTRDEQIGDLFMWYQSINGQINNHTLAVHEKMRIEREEMQTQITRIQGELAGISRRKGDTINTTDKFKEMFAEQNKIWIAYRDKVLIPSLAYLHTFLLGGLIYLIAYLIINGRTPW